MATFLELGLKEEITKALTDLGYENPTVIQEKAIPQVIASSQDLKAFAQTGTGKTAAFSLPILEQIDAESKETQVVILSPTRELAVQIGNNIKDFSKYLPKIKVTTVYGGANIDEQIRSLKKGSQIVVGTPGRTVDLINRKALKIGNIKWLVLDEADEMLNMGFKDELDKVLDATPSSKQTLLFSATFPKEVEAIAKNYMTKPVEITSGQKNEGSNDVSHEYYLVNERTRYPALKRIADVNPNIYAIVFCRTRRETQEVANNLIKDGYNADALHGDLSQAQRDSVMQKFRKKICNILVVTDVASRGIDVKGLSHVINYAIPQDPESYVHRVGRTGRAGKTGTAITFITPSEFRKLMYIQKVSKKDISKKSIPDVNTIIEAKKKRITQKIQELQQGDLEQNLLTVAEEILSEKEPKEALAAVLKLAFDKEFSEDNYKDIRAVGKRDSHKSGRGRDRDRHDRRDRNDRHSIDDSGQARLFIAKGKKDRMTPKELVAYIEKKSGVFGKRIQGVQIYDKFSFVNTSFSDAEQIVQAFKSPGKRSLVEFAK